MNMYTVCIKWTFCLIQLCCSVHIKHLNKNCSTLYANQTNELENIVCFVCFVTNRKKTLEVLDAYSGKHEQMCVCICAMRGKVRERNWEKLQSKNKLY